MGWSDGLGENEDDGSAVISGEGWITLSSLGLLGFRVFLVDLLLGIIVDGALGVFMVMVKEGDEEGLIMERDNEWRLREL